MSIQPKILSFLSSKNATFFFLATEQKIREIEMKAKLYYVCPRTHISVA